MDENTSELQFTNQENVKQNRMNLKDIVNMLMMSKMNKTKDNKSKNAKRTTLK